MRGKTTGARHPQAELAGADIESDADAFLLSVSRSLVHQHDFAT